MVQLLHVVKLLSEASCHAILFHLRPITLYSSAFMHTTSKQCNDTVIVLAMTMAMMAITTTTATATATAPMLCDV